MAPSLYKKGLITYKIRDLSKRVQENNERMRKLIDSQNRAQLRIEREALMSRMRSLPSSALRRAYMQARLRHVNKHLDEGKDE